MVRSPAQARASPQRMASGGQRGGERGYLTVEACLVMTAVLISVLDVFKISHCMTNLNTKGSGWDDIKAVQHRSLFQPFKPPVRTDSAGLWTRVKFST